MASEKRHPSGDSADSSQYIPLPPDGAYGWVVVVASFAIHVIVDGITFTFGIFYSDFSEYYGGSKGQTSLVGALLAACYLLAAPFAGSMVNKFGCRCVSVAGSLIAATGFLLSTLSPSIHWLMLTYGIIGGFGLGLLYLPSIIAVSYYFDRRRALATGIAVCGAGVGCFLMAPVGRQLLDSYDWKNAMFIVAGISLNGCVFGALLRPLETPMMMQKSVVEAVEVVDSRAGRPDSAILLDEGEDVTGVLVACRSYSDANEYRIKPNLKRQKSCEENGTNRTTKTAEGNTLGRIVRRYKSETYVGEYKRHPGRRSNDAFTRPLYRKDIFYSGSTLRLTPEFQQQPDQRSFVRQMTVRPDESSDQGQQTSPCLSKCLPPLSKAVKFAWNQMTNISILKDPMFIIPCIGNLFGTVGLFVPFVYSAERAVSFGVETHLAAFLLSIIGITNTIGRIVAGCIASISPSNSLLLHNVALIAAGVTCMANATFGVTYPAMVAFAAIFGLCIATWISLTSVVLCDLLGIERLTNAFGLLTMTRGLAAMIGSPIAGFVFDATGNYDASFHIGGAVLASGGVLCCLLHLAYFRPMVTADGQKKSESGFDELDFESVHVNDHGTSA